MEKWDVPNAEKTRQDKHRKSEAGSQRYLCKQRDKTYVTVAKWRRYNEETKKQEIQLYMEGNSGRAVGRILGISVNICIYWIKKYAKTIKERYPHKRVEVIEMMDELYSFIEKKTSNCRLWYSAW